MASIPLTRAEEQADAATKLTAFPVNLRKIRTNVASILSEWKGAGFFTEYTDHSFEHVVDMLTAVDWVVPSATQEAMSDGDWLMLVLSIYFHDIGLLITQHEYDQRNENPDYKTFLANSLLPSDKQAEFSARLAQLSDEEASRLRYQEFVRYSHGKRVRAWLEGSNLDDGGATATARKLIADLVSPLDPTFRRDLALISESHTLNNIDNTAIFKVSQPYGSAKETVNLQYVAVVLRTVDLLQITKKRAPSVLYQLINPSNPASQVEWRKQGAVRAVRPAPARDRDGAVTEAVLADTIEVHATFEDPDGFFGLTSYLSYAAKELSLSHAAIQRSSKDTLKKYLFPWRHIDTRGIDTEGFLTDSFEFELDQHKILDLLTGHTLYNNSTVVLRELTQNALDAVRLQAEIEGKPSEELGTVKILWNSVDRSLTVQDNGTGMSQEMVVNHLLKVGSSRYQDPKFREKHPKFHSISRFGIGVLSAFMVSDDVEITTCNEEDEKARRIALRSVHGKYLIKLLDKLVDRPDLPIFPHGTSVRLVLRPTAEIGDVLKVARSWLMFPRCTVTVQVDDADPVAIGFRSPKEAIQTYLDSTFRKSRFKQEYKVVEAKRGGISLAFAVAKDELFQDWGFVMIPDVRTRQHEDEFIPLATCVEGVAVEQNTPGFRGKGILAVANAIGSTAPRTNVARSSLEDTREHRNMLEVIYSLYANHVAGEVNRLSTGVTYSLSRAVGMVPFIAGPLLRPNIEPTKSEILTAAMADIPIVLVEDDQTRSSISLKDLGEEGSFVTIESPLYRSIEYFVKEAPADVTANGLLTVLGNRAARASGKVVCNLFESRYIEIWAKQKFEVAEVSAAADARTLKLHWERRDGDPRWFSSESVNVKLTHTDLKFVRILNEARDRSRGSRNGHDAIHVPLVQLRSSGLDSFGSFVSNRDMYLVSETPLASYLTGIFQSDDSARWRRLAVEFELMSIIRSIGWSWEIMTPELIERALSNYGTSQLSQYLSDKTGLVEALRSTSTRSFDPFAWDRRESGDALYAGW